MIEVTARQGDDAVIFRLNGPVDVFTSDLLREQFDFWLSRGQCHFVLDFANVERLDHAGLSALVSARKKARFLGGTVKLIHVCDDVRDVLYSVGLDHLFPAFVDTKTALAA